MEVMNCLLNTRPSERHTTSIRKSLVQTREAFFIATSFWRLQRNGQCGYSVVVTGDTLFRQEYFELRYEDLHVDPETVLRNTLSFLGASAQTEVVQACVKTGSFQNQSGRNPGELAPLSYFRRGIVGDWRNFLTPPDLEILNKLTQRSHWSAWGIALRARCKQLNVEYKRR